MSLIKGDFLDSELTEINDGTPILIYQMGKVGSKSVYNSLKKNLISNVIYHVHFLSHSNIEEVESYLLSLPHITDKEPLRKSKRVREIIDQSSNSARFKIITMVREPIAREISDLFQNINRELPSINKCNLKEKLNSITAFLHKSFSSFDETDDYACTWFDKEIKDVFNFDIYTYSFDKSLGYHIYRNDQFDILIIRLEDLSRCFNRAMSRFFKNDDINFTLENSNRSSEKPYRQIYEKVRTNFKLPVEILDKVYSTRYSKHFYSEDDLEKFKAQWRT